MDGIEIEIYPIANERYIFIFNDANRENTIRRAIEFGMRDDLSFSLADAEALADSIAPVSRFKLPRPE